MKKKIKKIRSLFLPCLLFPLLISSCMNDNIVQNPNHEHAHNQVEYVSIQKLPQLIPNIQQFNKSYNYLSKSFTPNEQGIEEDFNLDLERILVYKKSDSLYSYSINILNEISEDQPYYFENLHIIENSNENEIIICRWTPDNSILGFMLNNFSGKMEVFDMNYSLLKTDIFSNGYPVNIYGNKLNPDPMSEVEITCVSIVTCSCTSTDFYCGCSGPCPWRLSIVCSSGEGPGGGGTGGGTGGSSGGGGSGGTGGSTGGTSTTTTVVPLEPKEIIEIPCKGDPIKNPKICPSSPTNIRGGTFGCTRGGKKSCEGIIGKKYHGGTDIEGKLGNKIYSMHTGKIVGVRKSMGSTEYKESSLGNFIEIESVVNGVTVRIKYCHMGNNIPFESSGPNGEAIYVTQGTYIGTLGRSGNAADPDVKTHLHLQSKVKSGTIWTATNPLNYFYTQYNSTTFQPILTEDCIN